MFLRKLSAVCAVLVLAPVARAAMLCEVVETMGSEKMRQTVVVEILKDNPHGTVKFVTLQKFTKLRGMLAVMRGSAVISVSDPESGFAMSSYGKVGINDIAHQQLIFPTADASMKSITVDCKLTE